MNTVFCIDCQEMVEPQTILCGEGHLKLYPVFDDNGIQVGSEIDCCEMPLGFAYCAPPEAPDMDLILFDRPYLDDLLEYQEQVEQAVGELLFELNVMEV